MADRAEIPRLAEYRKKRDFSQTPEPSGGPVEQENVFVVQKHAASHLHYDFRLRLHGALKSWAIPKGPSLDPSQSRLADQTEDHPLQYAEFEGVIPAGNYGAGSVMIWDQGVWESLGGGKQDYYRGHLHFVLYGRRLRGRWSLHREKEDSRRWFLVKEEDEFASTEDVLVQDVSVVSGRTLEQIAADSDRLWTRENGLILTETKPEFGHRPGGSLPDFIPPQQATLVDRAPEGDEWLHEIKHDGYRMLCRIDKDRSGIRFFTRKGIDFTDRLAMVRTAVERLSVRQAWLDGEIVVLTAQGKSDFHALQNAFTCRNDSAIVYLVFDLMNYEGYDLRGVPLSVRKAILADLVPDGREPLRYVDHVVGHGEEFYQEVCSRNLEGVLSKQLDSGYVSERSRCWLKVKCAQRQEFVLGGYTESGVGRPFGSLLAGYYDQEGKLVFAGKIKTGYRAALSQSLIGTLRMHEQSEPPFVNPPSGVEYRNPHWLRPELVAEVAFAELSGTGLLRHASFKGLRDDKDAREVRVETPEPVSRYQQPGPKKPPVFPHERISRDEIVDYYRLVAARMLPHIADRPLTLIVCPTNIYACKFTKHATHFPPPVRAIDTGHDEKYIALDSAEGLLALVERGAVEIHGWQSRHSDLEHPDRLLLDLDTPYEEAFPWERIAEAALLLRIHLQQRGLESYLQTTGGKGYYVVVPLVPRASWKAVTSFAKMISEEMERSYPDRFAAKLAKEQRLRRIYVDWMRNGKGANAAEPYSIRARPGAPVATPVSWEELVAGVKPDSFNLRTIRERLAQMVNDPWEGYFQIRQMLPG